MDPSQRIMWLEGDPAACRKKFAALDPTERLEALEKANALQNAIYREKMTNKMRSGPFEDRLRADWKIRLAYLHTKVAPEILNAPITRARVFHS